ncbi:MAG: Uma2 family endonuclease [Bacteroidota bacterium]
MRDLVAAILDRPDAPNIVKEVQNRLEEEKLKRQHFYAIIDEDTKAEFINGEIVYHSPVKKEHNDVAKVLFTLLQSFVMVNDLGYLGYDKIMVSLTRNDFEPDICFFNKEKAQHFVKGQMHFPAPDFVVEVLSSNEQYDRNVKFKDYELHQVKEYWIIDPHQEIVEQYLLGEDDQYALHIKASDGPIHSKAIKGFSIPIRAIFDETLAVSVLKDLLQ